MAINWNSNNIGNSYGAEGLFWGLLGFVFLEKLIKTLIN